MIIDNLKEDLAQLNAKLENSNGNLPDSGEIEGLNHKISQTQTTVTMDCGLN